MLPPPYSPRGMSPSNSRYSSGWSSVWTARLLRFGSSGMPRGTAHDSSTPSCSRRRSQCMLRAWCSWITNRPPGSPSSGPPAGSGVASKSRFLRYLSRRLLTPPWWPAAGAGASNVFEPPPPGHPGARPRFGRRALPVEPRPQRLADALQLLRLGGDPHLEVVRGPVLPLGHVNRVSAESGEVGSRHGAAAASCALALASQSAHARGVC